MSTMRESEARTAAANVREAIKHISTCGDCGLAYTTGKDHTCPTTIAADLLTNAKATQHERMGRNWTSADAMIAEAVRLTSGDRNADYGNPEDDWERAAQVFSGILGEKLNAPLTASDCVRCMIGMKLVRDAHKPKRDNRGDGVGYFRCLERIEPTDAR